MAGLGKQAKILTDKQVALAWISTERNSPDTLLAGTAHFRVPSPRNYHAKWCSDNPIAQRLLARRTPDSGQFRDL